MEARSHEDTVQPGARDGVAIRLGRQYWYGRSLRAWWFLAVDHPKKHLIAFRISREGDVMDEIPFPLRTRTSLALTVYKSAIVIDAEERSYPQCIVSSLCWAGIQVEISDLSNLRFPHLKDFYVPLFNSMLDAIEEVFSDRQFALEVFSFCPRVEAVE